MATIHLLCGTISSGKTTYARKLQQAHPAVMISCDELTLPMNGLFPPENHDAITAVIRPYLVKIALDTTLAGADVILDWGFWRRQDRLEITRQFQQHNVNVQWYYLHPSDQEWQKRIDQRNAAVAEGTCQAYTVDEGLRQKCLDWFDAPQADEMQGWIVVD
ncbi:MAG: ATP-binding protein [Clostridiales bacterium]|nr:ATP-binding protein [Clostridiales bacterium]